MYFKSTGNGNDFVKQSKILLQKLKGGIFKEISKDKLHFADERVCRLSLWFLVHEIYPT